MDTRLDLEQFIGHTKGPWTNNDDETAPSIVDIENVILHGNWEDLKLMAAAPALLVELTLLRAENERMASDIVAYNEKSETAPTLHHRPKLKEGLLFLADWFDHQYPDDPNTTVQDDLREWSKTEDTLHELRAENERMRKAICGHNKKQIAKWSE